MIWEVYISAFPKVLAREITDLGDTESSRKETKSVFFTGIVMKF